MEYKLAKRFSSGISASTTQHSLSFERKEKFLTVIHHGSASSNIIEFINIRTSVVLSIELESFDYVFDEFQLKKVIHIKIRGNDFVACIGTGVRSGDNLHGCGQIQITELSGQSKLKTLCVARVITKLNESEVSFCRGFIDQLSTGLIVFGFSGDNNVFTIQPSDIDEVIERKGRGEIETLKR